MNFDFNKFWSGNNTDNKEESVADTQKDAIQAAFYRLKLLKKRMLVRKIDKFALFAKVNNSIFRFRYLILSVLVLAVFITAVVIIYTQFSAIYKSARAGAPNTNTVSFGGGNISIDKVYVSNGLEVTNQTITQGEAMTVRLKYNNTGTSSATNALISESIPTGFTYQTGTLKNCYADLACVDLNDNLVSSSILNVTPSAGFFGYSTDNSLKSSNLELGKKHYLHLHQCSYQSSNTDKDLVSSFVNTFSNAQMKAGTQATNLPNSALSCGTTPSGYTYQLGYSAVKSMNLSGSRYLNLTQCSNFINNDDYFNSYVDTFTNTNAKSPSNTSSSLPTLACGAVISGYTLDNTYSKVDNIDLLGNRFLHLHQCFYTAKSGRDLFSTLIDNFSSNFFKAGSIASNNSSMNLSCGSTDSKHTATAGYSKVLTLDMIDTSRGYGYIEYQMSSNSNTPLGLTGTNVSMSGSMGTITTTTNQGITVSGYFNDGDTSNTTLNCNSTTISPNSNLSCTFILPSNKLIPKTSIQAFLESSSQGVDCILDVVLINQINCSNIPTSTLSGSKFLQFTINGGNKINTKTQVTVLADIYLENGNIPGDTTVNSNPAIINQKGVIISSPANLKKSDNKTNLEAGSICTNTLILNQGKPVSISSTLDINAQCVTEIDPNYLNALGTLYLQTTISIGEQQYSTGLNQAYITSNVTANGLQLYYDLQNPASYDGSSQIINDLSGNNHFAFLGKDEKTDPVSDPSYNKDSKSLIFDGNSQFLETQLNSDFSNNITAEIWFKQSDLAKSDGSNIPERLLTQFSSGQSMSRFGFGIQKNSIQIQNIEDSSNITDSSFIPATNWQSATFTFDGDTNIGQIFTNGVKQADFSFRAGTPSSGNIKIGIFDETRKDKSKNALQGEISVVRIYDRVLSTEELMQNFEIDKSNYGFSEKSLNITNTNTTIFTNVSVSPTSQTSSANIANLNITDRRQSSTPWTVSISASDFAGCTLKASNISINPGSFTLISGSNQQINPNTTIQLPGANQPVTLISTNGYNGGGSYSLTPTLILNIPPYTRAGTCSTNITISSS